MEGASCRPIKVLRALLVVSAICLLLSLIALLFAPASFRKELRQAYLVWLHDSKGSTLSIHKAAQSGDLNTLSSILATNHSLVSARNEYGETPLHLAAQEGHLKLVDFLLSQGVKINAKDASGKTPLHAAASFNQPDIVNLLLLRGAHVNAEGIFGDTPLDCAAGGNKDVVQILLDHGADFYHLNSQGHTPLRSAIESGRENNIRILFAKGVRLDPVNDDSLTHLPFHRSKPSLRIAKLLIEHGANVNAQTEKGISPLFKAVVCGNTNLIQLLLSKGAIPDIYVASALGDTNRVTAILKTNIHLSASEDKSWMPIHWAACYNQREAVDTLLQHGADVNSKMVGLPEKLGPGDSPLHLAAMKNHLALAEYLLSKGADVNARGEKSETPLFVAAIHEHVDMVKLLLSKGAVVNVTNSYPGNSVLSLVASNGNQQITKLLLSQGADINLGNPLCEAASKGHSEIAELLLARSANMEATNAEGRTPLKAALRNNHLGLAKLLQGRGAKLDFLSACALATTNEVIAFLNQEPARVKQVEKDGWSPLHYAAIAGNLPVCRLLIARGAAVNVLGSNYFSTTEAPLHLACRNNFQEVVEFLLKNNADPNIKSAMSPIPLQEAVINHNQSAVKLLLNFGADVNRQRGFLPPGLPLVSARYSHEFDNSPIAFHPSTALESAAYANDKKMIELLLAHGANINAPGCEPLLIPVKSGNLDLAEFLIQKGADVNARHRRAPTSLHLAVRAGHEEMVKLLLKHGAKVDVKDRFGETPFDDAILNDHEDIAQLLRQRRGTL